MPDNSVNIPEERLVDQARQGDRSASKALFIRHRDVALRVALRVTSNEADAMDIVQDAFIKAFASLESLSDSTRFRAWLLRIVNNKALDLLRSKKVRKALSIEHEDEDKAGLELEDTSVNDPNENISATDNQQRIQQAIANLPEDQRSVILLYTTGGLTYGEIAETIGIPLGTVMSRIYRARQQLTEWLPDLAPERSEGKN